VFSSNTSLPRPKSDQVCLNVRGAGINPVDWKILYYNWTGMKLPNALGCDASGVIVGVGENVKDWKVGDEVVASMNLWAPGSFADYAVVEEHRIVRKPAKVTHLQAASLPVAFLSAWDGFNKVKVQPKQSILVPGGAGGVGHFIVQLAQYYDLNLIATGGKEDSLKVLREDLKVKNIINYSKQDVVASALKIAGEQGVDFVFDSTYIPSSFMQGVKALKKGGTFILLGGSNTPAPESELAKLAAQKSITWVIADLVPYSSPGSSVDVQKATIVKGLTQAMELIEAGKLRPIIKAIPLSETLSALETLKAGYTIPGKIVIDHSL